MTHAAHSKRFTAERAETAELILPKFSAFSALSVRFAKVRKVN